MSVLIVPFFFAGLLFITLGALPNLHRMDVFIDLGLPKPRRALGDTSASSKFFSYTDIPATYERQNVWSLDPTLNLTNLCPQTFTYTSITPPQSGKSYSYRLPHSDIYADGQRCSSSQGPFTAEYSFSESAEFIPASLVGSLWADEVSRYLISKCSEKQVLANGTRCFFGHDSNAKSCGVYMFPGADGNHETLTMFLAATNNIRHPVLGMIEKNNRHLVTVVRNSTHTLYRCTFVAPPPKVSPSPSPSSSAGASQSASVSPTAQMTPSLSATPTPSATASLSVGASPSPSSAPPRTGLLRTPTVSTGSIVEAHPTQPSSACFPSDAQATLISGRKIALADLQIGDYILVGADAKYSRVFMFTHRLTSGIYPFIRITLKDGRSLRLSGGHYTADGIAARDIRVGDMLDGSHVVIVAKVFGTGLMNPHTENGNIVIDDVRVSTYTETVPIQLAHPLLLVVRMLSRIFGIEFKALENAVGIIVEMMHPRK